MNTQQTPWYKSVLLQKLKEVFTSAVPYLFFVLALLLWRFVLGVPFAWVQVTPLSEPEFFYRAFYSAFTFATLGFALYEIKFYKVLHDIVVKAFGMWGLYNLIKGVIWLGLMFVSYQYLVPALFKVFNTGATVLYNAAALVLYTFPAVGISVILTLIYILLRNYRTK